MYAVAVFQFTQTEYTVEESVGDFLVTIELIEGTLGIPITVTVQDVPMSGSGSVPPGGNSKNILGIFPNQENITTSYVWEF